MLLREALVVAERAVTKGVTMGQQKDERKADQTAERWADLPLRL